MPAVGEYLFPIPLSDHRLFPGFFDDPFNRLIAVPRFNLFAINFCISLLFYLFFHKVDINLFLKIFPMVSDLLGVMSPIFDVTSRYCSLEVIPKFSRLRE
ncbi:hypothetical protein C5B91_21465, partial [Haloferax sp. Atlit-10N]